MRKLSQFIRVRWESAIICFVLNVQTKISPGVAFLRLISFSLFEALTASSTLEIDSQKSIQEADVSF